MLIDKRQIYSLSIVALGDFNPIILQPYWLVHKGLVGEQEANEAKVDLIHQEVVNFSLPWVSFSIQKNRFELKTSQEPFESLRDLYSGIFKFLPETPIKRIGINHIMHFQVRDKEEMFNIGNVLAPLKNWEFFESPRVQIIEIIEQARIDGIKGHRRVKIEPSDLIVGTQLGISVNFNDDYILDDNYQKADDAVKLLANQWTKTFQYANSIVEGLDNKLFG